VESPDAEILTEAYLRFPYSVYRKLRSTYPIYWSDHFGAWILMRYDDVATVIRDSEHFSNADRIPALLRQLPPSEYGRVDGLSHLFSVGLVHSDPPDHTRLRRLVSRAFTPAAVEQMRPRVAQLASELLAEVGSEFDVVRDFAYPLPVTIISEMVGIPVADREQFRDWSTRVFSFLGTGRPDEKIVIAAQQALLELASYFRQLFADKKARPGEDLLSKLVLIEEEGDRLSEDELLSICTTFVTAGHETTTSLIATGALHLLAHEELRSGIAEDPEDVVQFVEELLRTEAPLQRDLRVATADVEIDGHLVRQGDLVYAMIGAANRDPDHFPEPDVIDPQRDRGRHLSFGLGIHFCLGAPLARMEAQVALTQFASIAGFLELAEPVLQFRSDISLRTLDSLRVRRCGGAQ